MASFRVLPGLPPYGPMYIPFTATGQGGFSEGFVVEFQPPTGAPWVGNFGKGGSSYSAALLHPNGTWVVVISRGQGYIVDPATKSLVKQFGGDFMGALVLPEQRLLILEGFCNLSALGPEGLLWETRRLSWDGLRSLHLQGDKLLGEALDLDDSWVAFEVDLKSGKLTGGSYDKPSNAGWYRGLIIAFGLLLMLFGIGAQIRPPHSEQGGRYPFFNPSLWIGLFCISVGGALLLRRRTWLLALPVLIGLGLRALTYLILDY